MSTTTFPRVAPVLPQQAPTPTQTGINISDLMPMMMNMMVVVMMMKVMMSAMAPTKPKKKLPFPLPKGYEAVGEWAAPPEIKPPTVTSVTPLMKASEPSPSGLRLLTEREEEEKRARAEGLAQKEEAEDRRLQLVKVKERQKTTAEASGGVILEPNWWSKYTLKDPGVIWMNPHFEATWEQASPDKQDITLMAIGVLKEQNYRKKAAKFAYLVKQLEKYDVFIDITPEQLFRGGTKAFRTVTAAIMEVYTPTGLYSKGKGST